MSIATSEILGPSPTGDFRKYARNGSFDPQGDRLFDSAIKPAMQSELNLRLLSPYQRALLFIDGTVTKFLESYTLEPIEVIKLSQIGRTLPADHAWLDASRGMTVLVRQVLLRGRYSSEVHAYGLSLIVPDHIKERAVREDLEVDGKGLGQILREHRVETFREVLWHGMEQVDELPEDFRQLADREFISRTYRIVAHGKPIMLIHEKFPRDNHRRNDSPSDGY